MKRNIFKLIVVMLIFVFAPIVVIASSDEFTLSEAVTLNDNNCLETDGYLEKLVNKSGTDTYAKLVHTSSGKTYEQSNERNKSTISFIFNMIFSSIKWTVTGAVIGLLFVLYHKRKLNTAKKESAAENYVVHKSFNLTNKVDELLYSTVSKTRIERDDDDGGRITTFDVLAGASMLAKIATSLESDSDKNARWKSKGNKKIKRNSGNIPRWRSGSSDE